MTGIKDLNITQESVEKFVEEIDTEALAESIKLTTEEEF